MSQEREYVGIWEKETPRTLSATCGHCAYGVELRRISESVEVVRTEAEEGPQVARVSACYVCPRKECHLPSLFVIEFSFEHGEHWGLEVLGQIPRAQATPMEGLPEAIEDDRDEAWSCYFGGDRRAAIVMGRAAVQRAVRMLGGEGRDLFADLDVLYAQHKVTEELREWANEVRIAATDAANAEDLGNVADDDEVKGSLDWMDAFLEFAVALPTRRRMAKAAQAETDAER